MSQLWIPNSAARSLANHKKAAPPKLGEAFGASFGREQLSTMQLPGGGVLGFDLNRLNLGDFRSMRDHYQCNISLAVLTFMMHQLDWRIECEDKKIQAAVEEWLRDMWTRVVRAGSQAYWAGFSPIVTQWENDVVNGRTVPTKFKDLVPEFCHVNWKTVPGYAPPGHPAPKHYIYDGIKVQGQSFPVPVDNTFWYPLLMENGDHYGRKLLRPAFPAWFFSQLMHLFSNRYFERFGEPLPIGRAPFDDELDVGDGSTISGKQAMENILGSIRNRSVVVLPNDLQPVPTGSSTQKASYDYEIEYLESQMRGADFERYMTRLDEEISLALFTPLLLVRTADVGSYSLGEGHLRMYLWMHNALASDFQEYLQKFVIDRFVAMNFSPKAPKARWKFKPGGKTDAETLRAIITGLISEGSAGFDLDELGMALGLSVHEVKQVTEAPADPNDPAEPGSPNAPRNPGGPPAKPSRDPRAGRVRNDTTVRTTKKQITARIAGQVQKQFREGTFGMNKNRMGYRRQFEIALVDGGMHEMDAATEAESIYERMNLWLDDVATVPTAALRDADNVVGMFDRLLGAEVDDLVA